MGVFQIPLPGCKQPFSRHINHPIPTCTAAFVQVAPSFFHSNCPSMRDGGRWANNLPCPHGDSVGELRRGASFVPPHLYHCQSPSFLHVNIDASTQTKEVLSFSLSLRQLQEVWPFNWKSWQRVKYSLLSPLQNLTAPLSQHQ